KLTDSGLRGTAGSRPPGDGSESSRTAPATFSLLAPAYAKKYGVDEEQLKQVLARIAFKNHKNGAKNPKAQFKKEVPMETILKSTKIADPLGIMDGSGGTDGSASATLAPAEARQTDWEDPSASIALCLCARPGEA